MRTDYFQPSAPCNRAVVKYEFVCSDNEEINIVDRHIPSGYASIVLNLSGSASIVGRGGCQLPPKFMVFPIPRSLNIGICDKFDSFIITCRASLLSRLIDVDCSLLAKNYYLPFESCNLRFDQSELMPLNAPGRIEYIEHLLIDCGVADYIPDEIDELYDIIMQSDGTTPINEHLQRFERSPRFYRKHFVSRVGISAKTLARLVRVNRLWSSIMERGAIDFQDMVFEGEYFDQAHLIHDFKQIVGETPSFFFNRNRANVSMMSGKN